MATIYCNLCNIEQTDGVFYFYHKHTRATVTQVCSKVCRSAELAIANRKAAGETDLPEIDMKKCLVKQQQAHTITELIVPIERWETDV